MMKDHFDCTKTYSKGDIVYFHPYEYIYNPNKHQNQFITSEFPNEYNGWHIYDEKIDYKDKLFEILTDFGHEIIDREDAYQKIIAHFKDSK